MSLRRVFLSMAEYVVCFAIFFILIIPIHEFCHLYILRLFGGNGYIKLSWFGASTVFTKNPSHPGLVALSGGLGVAGFYALLAYWDWIDKDIEEFASLLPFISSQLSYGIFESIYVYTMPVWEFVKWSDIVLVAGFIIGLLPSLYFLIKRLAEMRGQGGENL